MKFSVGDYYVKLGSSPGSIDSEFKHPYLINSLLLPIFLDVLMALVILVYIFRYIPTNIATTMHDNNTK